MMVWLFGGFVVAVVGLSVVTMLNLWDL